MVLEDVILHTNTTKSRRIQKKPGSSINFGTLAMQFIFQCSESVQSLSSCPVNHNSFYTWVLEDRISVDEIAWRWKNSTLCFKNSEQASSAYCHYVPTQLAHLRAVYQEQPFLVTESTQDKVHRITNVCQRLRAILTESLQEEKQRSKYGHAVNKLVSDIPCTTNAFLLKRKI
jgi:hypothetical protein